MAKDSNSKQRLIPWLLSQLDRKETTGLEWVDEGLREFRIPWKHGGKQNFDSEGDSKVFRDWAIHTGRYSPASDKADPTKWKQNLRCAFNKSKDIKEVKDKHCLEGPDPHKVYRITQRQVGENRLVGSAHCKVQAADSTSPDQSTLTVSDAQKVKNMAGGKEASNVQIPNLACFNSGPSSGDMASLPDSLKLLKSSDLVQMPSQDLRAYEEGMETSDDFTPPTQELLTLPKDRILPPTRGSFPAMGTSLAQDLHVGAIQVSGNIPATPLPEENNHPEMYLLVKYCNDIVINVMLDSPLGCRIMHVKQGSVHGSQSSWLLSNEEKKLVFGEEGVQDVKLPRFVISPASTYRFQGKNRKKTESDCQMALDAMYRGLILKTQNGDIIAQRHCKCGIYYVSDQTEREPKKLNRVKKDKAGDSEKLFDMNIFSQNLEKFLKRDKRGSKPHPFVYLVFGQPFSAEACIVAMIASKLAIDKLNEADPENVVSVEALADGMHLTPIISITDSLDDKAMAVQTINELGLGLTEEVVAADSAMDCDNDMELDL